MVTKCEALLLETYGLEVPEVVEQTGNHDPDDISESILRHYHPAVLAEKYPAETTGDGNCFYRLWEYGSDANSGLICGG
jgi:hypothetical protein